jgi:hypothetical protein
MGNGKDYCEVMCQDLSGADNVLFINERDHLPSHLAKLTDLVLQKISRETGLSFFRSGYFKSYLCGASLPDARNLRFVFFDSNPHARDRFFLEYLKKEYRAKLILYVMNPTSAIPLDPDLCRHFYDAVFTVYARDAEAFGWRLMHHLYSRKPEKMFPGDAGHETDVFFAGRAKNRLQILHKLFGYLTNHDMSCEFYISDVAKNEMTHTDGITYNQWLPYAELIRRMQRSKCVLEILQRPGEGPTLRMIEGIVYNKKIITNDAGASDNPFYDKRFMHIFDTPENLDPDFIRNAAEPDYRYQEEYSAWNLLGAIEELFDQDGQPVVKN